MIPTTCERNRRLAGCYGMAMLVGRLSLCMAIPAAMAQQSAVIDLRADSNPPKSLAEPEDARNLPRLLDKLGMQAMFLMDRLHEPEVLQFILDSNRPEFPNKKTMGDWTQPLYEGEANLAENVRIYAYKADQFERAKAARSALGLIASRARVLRESKEFILPFDHLRVGLFNFRQKAFEAEVSRLSRTEGVDGLPKCVVLGRAGSPPDAIYGCIYLTNLQQVSRPIPDRPYAQRVVETAPFRYIPFEEEDEASQFSQLLKSRTVAPYLFVKQTGPLDQKPPAPGNVRVRWHVKAQITRLVFATSHGEIKKSFLVPEVPHASDGLPIKLPETSAEQRSNRAARPLTPQELAAAQRAKEAAAHRAIEESVARRAKDHADRLQKTAPAQGVGRPSTPEQPTSQPPVIIRPQMD